MPFIDEQRLSPHCNKIHQEGKASMDFNESTRKKAFYSIADEV